MSWFKRSPKVEHDWGPWSVDEGQTAALRGVGIVNRRTCRNCGVTVCHLERAGYIGMQDWSCEPFKDPNT